MTDDAIMPAGLGGATTSDGVHDAAYWQARARREVTALLQELPPVFEHYSEIHALASAAWLRGYSDGSGDTLKAASEGVESAFNNAA